MTIREAAEKYANQRNGAPDIDTMVRNTYLAGARCEAVQALVIELQKIQNALSSAKNALYTEDFQTFRDSIIYSWAASISALEEWRKANE